MHVRQEIKIIYMVDREGLISHLRAMMAAGYEISTVASLRKFSDPEMSGRSVTDWLIIYSNREKPE